MTVHALRAVAVAIALAGLVDPSVQRQRTRPLPVDIRATPSWSDPAGTLAARVKADIERRLADSIETSPVRPSAVVFVGGMPETLDLPAGVPVSTVSVEPRGSRVRIVDARAADAVIPGQRAIVSIELEGSDVAGRQSIVVLERDGLEVARATHTWTSSSGRVALTLAHTPVTAGLVALRVRVTNGEDDGSRASEAVDVTVRADGIPLRVLAWEARPSWSLGFVRRSLEADRAFDVSSAARTSRGVETRAGAPPAALSAAGLAPFDVVLVGAPEDLTRRDVDALDTYMRERGGAVVLLPDRIPSGPYRQLMPTRSFDEVLLDRPAAVAPRAGDRFLSSEFALPSAGDGGAEVAAVTVAGAERPAVASWPRGAGVVVFSGALDAWRYRGERGDGFGRFWVGVVASLGLASPPALSASVEPALAAPGDRLVVKARYRASELAVAGGRSSVPAVSATVIGSDGAATPVRLWPAAALGDYEGTLEAPAEGRYDVRVSGRAGVSADAPLVVESSARSRRFPGPASFIAPATGGVATDAADTAALEAHLRGLPRPVVAVTLHPMRSPWWIVPLAGALCVEWGLRRRNGLP